MQRAKAVIFRSALIIISLLLVGYFGFLLLNLYRYFDQAQREGFEREWHSSEKQSLALETFFRGMEEDLLVLSEKYSLQAYFENLGLGMSMEYGLAASIEDMRNEIKRFSTDKKLGDTPFYSRIVFVNAAGDLLADSRSDTLPAPAKKLLAKYSSGTEHKLRLLIDYNPQGYEMILSYPYHFKKRNAGHLLAWVDPQIVYRHFVDTDVPDKSSRNTLRILSDREHYIVTPPHPELYRIDLSALPAPAALKSGIRQIQLKTADSRQIFQVTAQTLPIADNTLFLTTFVLQDENMKSPALQLVLISGAVGLLIITGLIFLVRTSLNTRLMETKLEETRLREEAIAAQNQLLLDTAKELRASQESLTLALDGANLGMWDWNIPGDTILFNENSAVMLGYRFDELGTGVESWKSLVHPLDMPRMQENMQNHLEGRTEYYESVHRCKAKSGEWHWILDRGRVVERDDEGKPLRMAGTHLDITSRKNAEEELAYKNVILETQSETSPDGILIVDNTGKTILFNRSFAEIWKLPPHILENRDDSEMQKYVLDLLKHPDDFVSKVAYLYEHHEEKSNDEIEFADGRFFDRFSSPFISADGEYLGRIWFFREITEYKLAEAALIEYQQQLQAFNQSLEERIAEEVRKGREKDSILLQQDKLASIGHLAAGVAHEINNPMGFIMSNLRTLKDYNDSIMDYIQSLELAVKECCSAGKIGELEEIRGKLDMAYILEDLSPVVLESLEGAERVKSIVISLKDFARPEENCLKEADLNQCIKSTVNVVRNELKYIADVNLQLGEIPTINCHPQQINQVLANLLVNAAQAIKTKGIITIATEHREEQVVITVSDNGEGIPAGIIDKIFNPFFTTKPPGQGTGLGLSISYDIINKHNGTMTVASTPGNGTTFTITLPVV